MLTCRIRAFSGTVVTVIIFEVCRDCMKYYFLRQINACVCLDQYEGMEGLLCNGLYMFFIQYTPTILRGDLLRQTQ
ncbi:hypothetical protein HMPREF1988_01261 [Porphyromonas gingivalis F0185]|nr:hypothetical protein HMPREF1988_01261 [Porphyromonas gingivalis F0185]ERJ84465.1 hypothetical protein HMPREF1989_01832 [Porphyromonas gingivalis F0566]